MNKQIIVAVLMMGLVSLAAGVGTYAYFIDHETSANNTFTASTLDMTVDSRNDPRVKNFTFTSLARGRNGSHTWTLRNIGTTNGTLDISNVIVNNSAGITHEPERIYNPDLGELGANINVTMSLVGGIPGTMVVYTGTLDGMARAHYDLNYALRRRNISGNTTYLVLRWYVPTTVGNVIQGDVATVNFTINLNQTV